uniref:Uncharacterized protein n=1 Tax=Heterorhabditis bacteriophora TaxID=37862 RepID=A0A1I7X8B6_HETBA
MPMIGARFYAQLEAAQMRNDVLENELSLSPIVNVMSYSALMSIV